MFNSEMYIVKVLDSSVKKTFRMIKTLCLGKSDVQTAVNAMNFGVDSNPIKDFVAVLSPTSIRGEKVILGYINRKHLAQKGEIRIYSVDEAGEQKTYVWCKNDGTIEVGGDQDHMVRYSKLELAFNQLRSDFNALVDKFNDHQHVTTCGAGPGTANAPASSATTSSADITPAKIDEIKTL